MPAERMDLTIDVNGVLTYMPPKSARVSGVRFNPIWRAISTQTAGWNQRRRSGPAKRSAKRATNRINTNESSACKDNIADKLLFMT